jgi:predicted secreted protein
MGIAGSLMVLTITWWIAFQALLPFGVRSHLEENSVVPGTEPSAPTHPGLWRKAVYSAVIAVAVWAVLFPVIEFHLLPIDTIPTPTGLKLPFSK